MRHRRRWHHIELVLYPPSLVAVRWTAIGPTGFGTGERRRLLMRRIATAVWCHWPVAALAMLAACLLFTNLGRDYLWEDEGDTAVLARSILQHGLPVAWDGVTFSDPDYGQRLTSGFVMVSHPWLQYYAAAASFALFGETPWAARLPFALAGLTTVVLVYAMMLAWLRNRLAAITAATLLTLSVQFLLFSRQARNYSFNALLTCLLIWQFHRLNSWRNTALFAGIGILLFHAHPIGLATVAMLGLLTVAYRPFRSARRWFWPAALAIALYAAPWLMLSRAGYEQNVTPFGGVSRLLPRLLQFAIECASVTPVIGLVVLYLVLRVRRQPPPPANRKRARREGLFASEEQSFVVACGAVMVGQAMVMAVTHSRDFIWIIGLHHTPAMIPLAMMVAGLLIVKVSRSSRTAWVALMLVFGLTRFAQSAPWTFWAEPVAVRDPDRVVTFHTPNTLKDRLLRTTQVQYVKSLVHPNPGVIARISEFLLVNAASGDVVITNYEWEALYFHTGLPQGAKVDRSFPIYPAARASQLPNYVFSAAGVRWIVWRRAWPAFFPGQDCERILRQLTEAGVTTELVASIPETLFENRENVHFRRFAGDTYIFPWHEDLPDVLIYRVDWQSNIEAHHQVALTLFAQQRFDEAVVPYRQYLKDRPDDVGALTNLGIAFIATGKIDEAIPVFRHAVDVAPKDGAAHRNLANALLDHGDAAEASSYAQQAVALRPNDPAAHDVLGRALTVQGNLAEATLQFERALQLDPGYAEAREHLERVGQVRRNLLLSGEEMTPP